MRIYVAGPYTSDPEACTRTAIKAGDRILDAGHAPFVPHLAHFWDRLYTNRSYEDWMMLDLAWLRAAHALLRLPGESSGADQEVALASELGIPVFQSMEDLLDTVGFINPEVA
jgi:hypothetical protein